MKIAPRMRIGGTYGRALPPWLPKPWMRVGDHPAMSHRGQRVTTPAAGNTEGLQGPQGEQGNRVPGQGAQGPIDRRVRPQGPAERGLAV